MLEIIPDPIHVGLLTLPFLVAVFGSWMILWSPLSAYLEERRVTVETANKEAEELGQSAEEQLAQLEEKLAGAREKVLGIHQAARERAQALVLDALFKSYARESIKQGALTPPEDVQGWEDVPIRQVHAELQATETTATIETDEGSISVSMTQARMAASYSSGSMAAMPALAAVGHDTALTI